jgi:hypothetical protein
MNETRGPAQRRGERENEMNARDPWTRFTDAELSGRESEAEAALRALFAELPEVSPRAGFTARVMARLPRRRPSWIERPAFRWGVGLGLAAAAIAVAVFPPAILPLLGLVGPAEVLHGLVAGFAAFAARLIAGFEVWQSLAQVAKVLGEVLLIPRLGFWFVLQAAVAGAAFSGLMNLLTQKRSSSHARLVS